METLNNVLVTPEVMKARIKFYFEEWAWKDVPEDFDGKSLDDLALELADAFEAPFYSNDDFLMPWEELELNRLDHTINGVDQYINDYMEGVYA